MKYVDAVILTRQNTLVKGVIPEEYIRCWMEGTADTSVVPFAPYEERNEVAVWKVQAVLITYEADCIPEEN